MVEQIIRNSTATLEPAREGNPSMEAETFNLTEQSGDAEGCPSESNLEPHKIHISEHLFAEISPTTGLEARSKHQGIQNLPSPTTVHSSKFLAILHAPLASAPLPRHWDGVDKFLLTLPRAFAPFPRNLDAVSLSYLDHRDALTLPSEAFQIAILKAYIEFVHPMMPILDLEEFLYVVKYGPSSFQDGPGDGLQSTEREWISLLLFQAVMCAGIAFIRTKILSEEGYLTRKQAQTAFFSRARVRSFLPSTLPLTLENLPGN